MSKEITKTPVALAISAVFGVALGTTSLVNAEENPFGMQDLSSGYMLLAEAEEGDKGKEGKCGEGKCGGDKGECDKDECEGDEGAGDKEEGKEGESDEESEKEGDEESKKTEEGETSEDEAEKTE